MQLFTKDYSRKAILDLTRKHTYDLNNHYDLYLNYSVKNSLTYSPFYREWPPFPTLRPWFVLNPNRFYDTDTQWRIENWGGFDGFY